MSTVEKPKMSICRPPKVVTKTAIGDFTLELNDWGEISISNKYEPTTFVIESKQTKQFVFDLIHLQNRKERALLRSTKLSDVAGAVIEAADTYGFENIEGFEFDENGLHPILTDEFLGKE